MTDNARKRAARTYQKAHPGTPYTQALREVSKRGRRPLTAALGQGVDGSTVCVNLEWECNGGGGPHCIIAGLPGGDMRTLLAGIGGGLAEGQDPGDLELVSCASESLDLIGDHHHINDPQGLANYVNGLLDERFERLWSLQCTDIERAREVGHSIPTTVVLIEDFDRGWLNSGLLVRWSRTGRSAGINIVLATHARTPASPHWNAGLSEREALNRVVVDYGAGNAALENMSASIIYAVGPGRGTLRTLSRWNGGSPSAPVWTDFTFQAT